MITLTPEEKQLARAALGLDGTRRRSYRNRFVAGPAGALHATWMAMVERGAALRTSGKRQDGTNIYAGGADLFELTQAGAEAALLPGETLDPEDFPLASKSARKTHG